MCIRDRNKELGITVVLVEHRLDLATRYSNRIVVLDKGLVALDGPSRSVYGKQAHLIGIGVPKVTLLFHLLKQDGVEIERITVTVEEGEEELRRILAD